MKKYDVVAVDFGENVGSEQSGVRPAIVVQNNMGNIHAPTTIVVPCTSKRKRFLPTHVVVKVKEGITSIALCEQIRVIDKSRIIESWGELDEQKSSEIDKALRVSLAI